MRKSFIAIILVPFCSLAWAAPDLNEAAQGVCNCLEEPYEKARQVMELISAAQVSGDTSALVAAQNEMAELGKVSDKCFDALAKKYPEISQSEELQHKVMNRAAAQCQNPAAGMSLVQ